MAAGVGGFMARVRNLSTLLDSLLEEACSEPGNDQIAVRDLLDAVGRRTYGPILLLLGFIAISPLTIIPGATWLVALVILVVAVQIIFGRKYPWIPRRALDFEFQRDHLERGVEVAAPWAKRIDWFIKPRLGFLTQPPFAQLVALICIAAALVSFPLGFIPFGPVLPGLAVMLFGLGLTSRDGLVILAAAASLAGAMVLLVRLWSRISGVF
ncbi:MAG: exopolysaccharide biosynthesis protein [Pseudomonadota bacterium]